jgi:hypothetical protein
MSVKIYMIYPDCDYDIGDVYYGSTKKKYLCSRLADHKCLYSYYKQGKHHKVTSYDLFDKYGVEHCKIKLIEEFKFTTKKAQNIKEDNYIRYNLCVNKTHPFFDEKEYKKSYFKNVIKSNKEKYDKMSNTRDEWFNKNKIMVETPILCQCGKTYTYKHKARHFKTTYHLNNLYS